MKKKSIIIRKYNIGNNEQTTDDTNSRRNA